jgi:16S rRNA (adenine1518-N6/adenine1519-N6)-dimethyltransferase
VSSTRRPLKSLGQNFLVDNNVIDRIIRNADIKPEDAVLEIGPGRGALTEHLARTAGRLVLIEYDHALAAGLKKHYEDQPHITVIDADVLAVNLSKVLEENAAGVKWKVVANLPYNISTVVLFRLLEVRDRLTRMILMLQKEVGDRLVAHPDCSDYGVTTVLLGLWFDMRREFIVPPGCFHPSPKVDSAVLSFVPLPEPRVVVGDEAVFKRVVKGAFGMRRKTLLNCLKASELGPLDSVRKILDDCGIEGKRRGETLSLVEFAALSRGFSGEV